MPNQLVIPFKLTQELDIKNRIREFIDTSTDTHPDEFKTDLNLWQSLRKDGTGSIVRADRIDLVLKYHAQLAFIMTKLPIDIGLEISYTQAFQPKSSPIVSPNLAYERAAVIFNLAALYSQLSNAQDRVSEEGIKRAKSYYENAAGALSYLASDVLPQLVNSLGEQDVPSDLSGSFLKSLEWLMLAQAQECAWQLVKMSMLQISVDRQLLTVIELALR
jgi:programmed cell death 6-interacting protein